MSMKLNEQELNMTRNVIERLADLESLQLILKTDFAANSNHDDKDVERQLNDYRVEYTLYNILAPMCYMFFSNRMSHDPNYKNTENDLEQFLRGWLTEPNFSWGIRTLLTNPRPPVTVTWSINDRVIARETWGLVNNKRKEQPQKSRTTKAKRLR